VSTDDSASHHKRTKKTELCEIGDQSDQDPVIEKLSKIGCLEKHYQVQDCYFETKDWRKCTKEVKQFQECLKQAKQNQK